MKPVATGNRDNQKRDDVHVAIKQTRNKGYQVLGNRWN